MGSLTSPYVRLDRSAPVNAQRLSRQPGADHRGSGGLADVVLDGRYHAGTYWIPRCLDAMRLAARLEAMITDPVYEGKSMAGLIDLVSRSAVSYTHLTLPTIL